MKKKPNNNLGNLNLSASDISAILCALPLVTEIDANSPQQNLLNVRSCESAGRKISNHAANISAEEIRVISIAVSAAVCIISGNDIDWLPDIDAEWKSELSKHFFTLNRLDPIFQNFVDEIYNRL